MQWAVQSHPEQGGLVVPPLRCGATAAAAAAATSRHSPAASIRNLLRLVFPPNLLTALPIAQLDMALAAGCSRCPAPLSRPDGARSTPWEPQRSRAQRASPQPAAAAAAAGGGSGSEQVAAVLPRRSTLLAALQAAALLLARPAASAEDEVLTVGAGKQFATISAALERAGSDATIVVSGGR